jgi:hypothetical protein
MLFNFSPTMPSDTVMLEISLSYLNNFFFPYIKMKKEVISLVFAHKGGFKNIVFQTALISLI